MTRPVSASSAVPRARPAPAARTGRRPGPRRSPPARPAAAATAASAVVACSPGTGELARLRRCPASRASSHGAQPSTHEPGDQQQLGRRAGMAVADPGPHRQRVAQRTSSRARSAARHRAARRLPRAAAGRPAPAGRPAGGPVRRRTCPGRPRVRVRGAEHGDPADDEQRGGQHVAVGARATAVPTRARGAGPAGAGPVRAASRRLATPATRVASASSPGRSARVSGNGAPAAGRRPAPAGRSRPAPPAARPAPAASSRAGPGRRAGRHRATGWPRGRSGQGYCRGCCLCGQAHRRPPDACGGTESPSAAVRSTRVRPAGLVGPGWRPAATELRLRLPGQAGSPQGVLRDPPVGWSRSSSLNDAAHFRSLRSHFD